MKFLGQLGIFLFFGFQFGIIQAAEVLAVNGKDVQIKLTADDFLEPNEKYFLINEQNKRAGIVNIVSVGDTEGKTILLKGIAKPGYKLQIYVAPKTTPQIKPQIDNKNPTTSLSKNHLGVDLDIMMNQMSLSYGETTLNLKGQGLGLSFGYFNSLNPELKIRYSLGYKNFSVKSEDQFCPEGSCEIAVGYAALGVRLHHFFNEVLFAGLGLEYLSPMNKSSTILTLGQIESNSIATLSVGFQISSEVHIALGYNHFLQNKNANASSIALQAGYMWPF